MSRFFWAILVILTAGSAAVAQTVAIRSGEHEGFTRLVMLLPPDSEWSISTSRRSLALKTKLPSLQFDVSQVFSRIPRSRLVALSQKTPGADLIFTLGCPCSVASFIEQSGFLVIDIKDGQNQPEPALRAFDLPTNQKPYRFSPRDEFAEKTQPKLPMVKLPIVIGQTLLSKPSPPPGAPVRPVRPPVAQDIRRPQGTLNISEERLLAQINRASDQGLLELRVKPETARSGALAAETKPGGSVADAQPMQNGGQDMPLPVSLSATTVIDRDLASLARSIDSSASLPVCLNSDQVALDEWAGTQPFGSEISRWRMQLFGEFDKVRPKAALGLARAYIHFGFGAEAGQAIDLGMVSNTETRILKSLTRILDSGGPVDDNPFAGQQHCNSDVALWALLAENSVAKDVNKGAVQLAFLRLPMHLRSYLGPKISRIFAEAGDGSMAGSILRAIARIDVEPGSGVELARAAVAELKGDRETAEQELMKSLKTGSQYSPEALVKLIANSYETDGAVAPELIDLAAAYALEYRNTDIGAQLRRAQAIALAMAGQFDEAFELLPGLMEGDGPTNQQLVLFPLLALLSERADDVSFLRYSMVSALEGSDEIPSDIANKTARRLLDLGFAESAWQWTEAKENPVSEERRLMRAEIALKRQLPNRALVELLGLPGPQAARLRAQAMWQEGDFQQAGQMLVDAQDFDAAARGFWMAENWEEVPEQADARYAQIVAGSVGLRASGETMTPMAPLAEARALMRGSSAARAQIQGLLQSASVESDPSQ